MSKEAMQAAALFAASRTKRADGKPLPASWILCVTWMAYYTRDTEEPYSAKIAQKTLVSLCQVKDIRAVSKMLDGLAALGVVTRGEKEGRNNVYNLHLPDADPVAYSQLFAPPEYRNHSTGITPQHRPYRADVADDTPVPQYPYQVGYQPHSTGNFSAIPALQERNTGPVGRNTGPVGAFLPLRENIGEEEEKGDARDPINTQSKEPSSDAEAEDIPTPLPPSPMAVMSAKDVWRLILDDLTDQKSKHELDSWYSRVSQVAWREDGALILRGAQSLMRFQQFRVCVEYALYRLGAEIDVEYQERDERQDRKARLAK